MNCSRRVWVEAICGFIKNQQLRVMHERDDRSQFLFHALRVVRGVLFEVVVEAQATDQRLAPGFDRVGRHPAHLTAETYYFAAPQIVVEHRLVRHVSHSLHDLRPPSKAIYAVNRCFTFCSPQYAHEHADGGGFSGAVRAQKSEYLSLLDLERKAVYRLKITIFLAQIVYSDQYLAHCDPLRVNYCASAINKLVAPLANSRRVAEGAGLHVHIVTGNAPGLKRPFMIHTVGGPVSATSYPRASSLLVLACPP